MNYSIRTLFALLCLLGSAHSFAQIKASIKSSTTDLPNQQTLQAVVSGGSGEYVYSWGIARGVGTVPENSSSSSIKVNYYEDAEYVLFVRDRKTGNLAYASAPVKVNRQEEKHVIQLPSEKGSKNRYFVKGALPNWAK